MTKIGPDFDPDGYAPVAERIRLFYETHPAGRIVTRLVSRSNREVVFRASVYRDAETPRPAATGWAAEREGDGEVNAVACLENTETSAIGRALANLGFTASKQRPSAEEMAKASRGRARLAESRPVAARVAEPRRAAIRLTTPALAIAREEIVGDLLALVARAERCGVRPARAAAWRAWARSEARTLSELTRCERRLRIWMSRQRRPEWRRR